MNARQFFSFYEIDALIADVPAWFHVQYVCVILVFKIMHLLAQIRVNHNFEVGVPKLSVNVKLFFVMSVLLGLDMWGIQVFFGKANEASTFYSWVLFEILSMVTSGVTSMIKFFVHLVRQAFFPSHTGGLALDCSDVYFNIML